MMKRMWMRKSIGPWMWVLFFWTVAVLCLPAGLQAEEGGGYAATGELSVGGRFIDGPHDSGKFNEYRDMSRGAFFESFRLDVDKSGTGRYYELGGQNILLEDQSYRLSVGNVTNYRFDFTWDQIPHVFSNVARTPYTGTGTSVLRIPDTVQTSLQNSDTPSFDQGIFLGGAQSIDLGFRRDRGMVEFMQQLLPGLNFSFSYANEQWDGTRPLTAIIGSSPGGSGHITEIPEPVDYQTNDLKAKMEYEVAGVLLQLSYELSSFNNNDSSLIWDNPLRIMDSTSQTSQARIALAPDNTAHTVSLTGASDLPLQSRVMGTFSYGWNTQNEAFLPHTINTAITSPGLVLPQNSLNGEVRNTLFNLVLTNRAIPRTSITARYRFYDVDNNSDSILFPGHVVGDTSLSTTRRRSLPYGLTKHDASVDARVRINSWLSVKPGWQWTGWNRDFYEAENSRENTMRLAFDLRPRRQVQFRGSYARSWREAGGYDFAAPLPSFPDSTVFTDQQSGLRKYDQASRTRDQAKLLMQYFPMQWMTFSAEGTYTNDDFRDPEFGLDNNTIWGVATEVTLHPNEIVMLWGSYSFESNEALMKSRQSSPTVNSATDNWRSWWRDKVHTVGVGVEGLLYQRAKGENKLTGFASVNFSMGVGATRTSLDNPASTLVTTAENYPDITTYLAIVRGGLKYQIFRNLGITGEYRFERLDVDDFTQTPVGVSIDPTVVSGTTNDFFLGAQTEGYDAHIAAVTFQYSFDMANLFASNSTK